MQFTKLSRSAFALGMIMLLAACGNPNPNGVTESGTITGRLIDAKTQQPIPSAVISVGTIVQNLTPSNAGGFVLSNVPVGQQTLTISAIGYAPLQEQVIVQMGQESSLGDLPLTPT
jgi:hypothetical protein